MAVDGAPRRRIAFISANESAPWGASEELWSQTAARMSETGVADVFVSVKGWETEAPEVGRLEAAGCSVFRRPDDGPRPFYDLTSDELSRRWVGEVDPNLVVVSEGDGVEGLGWMELCLTSGRRYATIAHQVTEYEWPRDPVARRLRPAYQGAEAAYFVSEHSVETIERQIGGRLPRARVVRCQFRVPHDDPPPWPPWPPEGRVRLACVARLYLTSKAQDVLLHVLALPKWRARAVEVTLFGDGPHREGITALRDLLGVENVTLAGFVDDVHGIWATHHALVLPSRKEGLPAAIYEAMLSARPAVVTDVGGCAEVVEDGVTGWIAAAPVPRLLDDALERAWAELERWPEFGARAATRARALYPPDPIAVFADELASRLESERRAAATAARSRG